MKIINGEQLLTIELNKDLIVKRTDNIAKELIKKSNNINKPNFDHINVMDLYILFDNYKKEFLPIFDTILDMNNFSMKLSGRLTKSGGITKTRQRICSKTQKKINNPSYEIIISSFLLFSSFNDGISKNIIINGIPCENRLSALQRIFEHELIHLLEMLIWNKSSCKKKHFRTIAMNIFNHKANTHNLLTQAEIAKDTYNLKIGMLVDFTFEGKIYTGRINRITKRATILVKHAKGRMYRDGNRYHKYYIPLDLLTQSKS